MTPGLGRDFRAILAAALEAVDPERLVRDALDDGRLAVPEPPADARDGDVVLLAVGKATAGMARGAIGGLTERIREGAALLPRGVGAEVPAAAGIRVFRGGHPLPDDAGVDAARTILETARRAGPGDILLFLVSGGGSALLTLPAEGVELEHVRAVTDRLLDSGADIRELNTVRKHLDRLKGGGLARAAAPTPVRAGALSDVVGDPLDVIASGPVSPDPTTYGDALEVLERRLSRAEAPAAVVRHLEAGARGERPETPKPGDPCFRRVATTVVGNAVTALESAAGEARSRGYRTRVLGADVTGEARDVGAELGRLARRIREGDEGPAPPCCVLAAGETTVTVTGDGLGGRNQEVALGAAASLDGLDAVLVASVGTDGVDGPTDAAGALATGSTLERARQAGIDPGDALDRNDSHPFFRELGDLVTTGPTGTNVMDLQVLLIG